MSSIPAQAVSDFFSDSNIQFYDPNACDPIGSTNASGTNDAIGGVTFTTEMNINTDGSGESHGNTFHQTETSFTNGGRPLNADELNFIALSPPWAESKNLKLGDLALVEYKDKKIFAIYGDNWNNSGEVHGEGSYRMAQILSDSENPNINVAIPSPVKYTIFPESHKKLPSSFDQSKVDGLGAEISGFSSSSTINESSFNNVCCPGGQGPNLKIGPVSLSGDTDAEKAFNFFVQKGMSKSGAAGVVGNLMRESGGDTYNLNTRAFNAAGFTGIVQWDNRRWDALQSYAAANKKDRYDLITQLEYIWIELTKGDLERNENQYKDLLNFLKNSPEDEASAIAAAEKVYAPGTGYERANHGLVERKENAKKAFEDFKDNPSGPGSAEISNIPSSTCCAIPGGGLSDSLPSSIPSYWRELINNAASKYPNSDPRLVAAVLWAENRGWPDPNKNWGVSSAGAKGPWQFIDSTWASMGQDGDGDGVKDPNNPKDAVLAAYIHHNGSKGKPLVEGFSGSAESYFNQATFQRNGKYLLSFGASYKGS